MLSVIVLTSPGREANLGHCLRALAGQTQPADQLIVVDDGSAGGRAVVAASGLEIDSFWRPNDVRLAYSRNLGARAARHPGLVFVDSDILLNPHALAYYRVYQGTEPAAVVYGYTGNARTPQDRCLSALIPNLLVHCEDQRFPWDLEQGLLVDRYLCPAPQAYAWSGNFGLSAEVFWSVGGFDETFQGWGLEDIDLAHRFVNAGIQLHFSLDVWGETCLHAESAELDRDRNASRLTPLTQTPKPAEILHDRAHSSLLQAWERVYAPQRRAALENGEAPGRV
ncbi:MAG TPA: glycosyltransferase [Candidatus Obscuribacterales bacterium]